MLPAGTRCTNWRTWNRESVSMIGATCPSLSCNSRDRISGRDTNSRLSAVQVSLNTHDIEGSDATSLTAADQTDSMDSPAGGLERRCLTCAASSPDIVLK